MRNYKEVTDDLFKRYENKEIKLIIVKTIKDKEIWTFLDKITLTTFEIPGEEIDFHVWRTDNQYYFKSFQYCCMLAARDRRKLIEQYANKIFNSIHNYNVSYSNEDIIKK